MKRRGRERQLWRIGKASRLAARRLAASAIAVAAAATCCCASAQVAAAPFSHFAWPTQAKAPANAPNVLVILTDDVGFGASSTFGGPVPTPNFDALARQGLIFNRFHTTALCSPTRAALLTGRNPHHIGIGDVTNSPSAFDGYTSVIPKSAATVAEILKENGYNTAMFGKSHLTPEWEQSSMGPFDHWPTGLGFEYFYGFVNADTDQFAPTLVENTRAIATPHETNYILDRDLADHAVQWIHDQHSIAPEKPFFMYYATGSTHAPQQAPADWVARFKGRFDEGWDAVRDNTFLRQKALGVVPKEAKLTPRPPELPAWASLSAGQKVLAERFMEAYAGQLAFADSQIGRVIQSLRDSGQIDNTMIVLIEGDNGPSAEGGLQGVLYEQSMINRAPESLDYALSRLSDIGGPTTYAIYPAEWAWAMSTPFQWFKQVASHFGGTRNGMVISWPRRIKDAGSLRPQFADVIDVAPTILEAAGLKPPAAVGGVQQMPLDGISLAYTFDHKNAKAERQTQYFEMVQNIGIYHDGWIAATHPAFMPWDIGISQTIQLSDRKWELYNIDEDFSESDNLASRFPDKLKEMQAIFIGEAERNTVLPVHAPSEGAQGHPSAAGDRTTFTYYPGTTGVYQDAAPHMVNRSFEIVADVVVPPSGADGVLLAQGGRFGGYSLYLNHGRPVFCYNAIPPRVSWLRSDRAVTTGHHVIRVTFASDGGGSGAGGVATLAVDGETTAQGRIDHTIANWISHTEGLDVGEDLITPVSTDYESPAMFTGVINKITIILK